MATDLESGLVGTGEDVLLTDPIGRDGRSFEVDS